MNRSLKKVRRRMKQRRTLEQAHKKLKNQKQSYLPYLTTEEEKHGIEASPMVEASQGMPVIEKSPKQLSNFSTKLILAALLFVMSALIIKNDHPVLNQSEAVVYQLLEREFPFASVHAWYENRFGQPLAVDSLQKTTTTEPVIALPASGEITETYHTNGNGIFIQTEKEEKIKALDNGIVLFAGKDKDTAWTVKIQHPDQSISTYGFLEEINVFPYQSVTANDTIATMNQADAQTIYFSVEKENKTIDPLKLIPAP